MIQYDTRERTMECDLTPEERAQRSDEAHATTAIIIGKEADHETLKAKASSVKKEVDQLNLKHRSLSEAARTGKESRTVLVKLLYDPETKEVIEQRDDTGTEILRRRPYADEAGAIAAAQQSELPFAGSSSTPFAEPEPEPIPWTALNLWTESEEQLQGAPRLELLALLRRSLGGESLRGAERTCLEEHQMYPPERGVAAGLLTGGDAVIYYAALVNGEMVGIGGEGRTIDWTGLDEAIAAGPAAPEPPPEQAKRGRGRPKKQ